MRGYLCGSAYFFLIITLLFLNRRFRLEPFFYLLAHMTCHLSTMWRTVSIQRKHHTLLFYWSIWPTHWPHGGREFIASAMFHTFEGFENPTAATPARNRSTSERRDSISRRVTTLRACTSCRHRKIKCDGEKPCEACRWYKKSDQCHYSDPRPSRRWALPIALF